MNNAIASIYSKQIGGELPYFVGNSNQWGGGILQTIARFAFPILRRLAGVAADTAEDVIHGRKPFKESLIDNAMEGVQDIIPTINTLRTDPTINRRATKQSNQRLPDSLDIKKRNNG